MPTVKVQSATPIICLTGEITFKVLDKNGKLKDFRVIKNTITNAGRAIISGLINGSGSPAPFTYLAVGTGTNAASASDTTLQTELSTSGLSRAAASVSKTTTSITNDTAVLTNTFTVTGTQSVTEAGAFNASSNGTMLGRQTFTAINVLNGDLLSMTYTFQNG